MSSILKVDQLQDSGGNNLVTSNGSGVITSSAFGKIGQVVQGLTSTETNVTTNSFTDTTLSASITPSSASSKVLIMVSQNIHISDNTSGVYGGIRLLRGTTTIYTPSQNDGNGPFHVGGGAFTDLYNVIAVNYLDSPASTSATTYKTQGAIYNSQDQITFQKSAGTTVGKSTIVLMEILP